MTSLKLIPANENRDGGPWSADDFDVVLVDTGKKVGRIYDRTSAGMGQRDWWWAYASFFWLCVFVERRSIPQIA